MSLDKQHMEWLSLIEISGPFLAVPVLKEVFPQGLEKLDANKHKRLRQAYDEWREAWETKDPQFSLIHRAWIEEVLFRGLELNEDGKCDVLKSGKTLPKNLTIIMPEHAVTLAPDYAVVNEKQDDKPLLLIQIYDEKTVLTNPIKGDRWIASPAERMVQMCRLTGCRMGLVTNGERWMLVDAPIGATTTFASWYSRLWSQEPTTLQAFVSLLGIRRFFLDDTQQFPALLDRSLQHQDEVTEALGEQVRRAVEVLIQALDRADLDRNRELLRDVAPAELYEAGLTVMMRLVFLLCAEERGLLLLGDERYETNYAISTLRDQLRKESDEILERRWDAWSRLLSVFRAVYGGIEHESLRMPALGGSLFDPDRFPFLEGRDKNTDWRYSSATPLPIDNRTVWLLLDAIQVFQGRTLSYRALDVEQIGYVYEGLLERTVRRTEEVTLELSATKKSEKPWVTLGDLESAKLEGGPRLAELLKERTGSSDSRIRNDLAKIVEDEQADRLLTACNGDQSLRDRIKPYFCLLRTDPWGYPLVYPKGSFTVMTGLDRHETGTHYTPKSLTEAVVVETLEPIVYIGPAEAIDRKDWRLKSPSELLELKICDMAMGSGAFLVQVCRWLSERLVESWHREEKKGKSISAEGEVLDTPGSKELLPNESEDRLIIARRLIAERCLYGVDLNPLAVELAKLSLWLVTLAQGRPFGFLDHNLRHGDSLLGIQNLDQLTHLSMQPRKSDAQKLFSHKIESIVQEAISLRRHIRNRPIHDIHDIEIMSALEAEASQKLSLPELIADVLIGATLESDGKNPDTVALSVDASAAMDGDKDKINGLKQSAKKKLGIGLHEVDASRKPFHWPLEFPEVFSRDERGFDAIVGNPPFLGGQKITGIMGTCYREFLVEQIGFGVRGSADLVAYFFLKAFSLLSLKGSFGLIAVNTIAEGSTREIGLEKILKAGGKIYAAYPNEPWPGAAKVITSRVHLTKMDWQGKVHINNGAVTHISASLNHREQWSPVKLSQNEGIVFQGSIPLGDGFLIKEDFYQTLLAKNDNLKDVLYQYLIGKEVNQSPTHSPGRWIINFFDWGKEKAERFSKDLFDVVKDSVLPERLEQKDRGAKEKWWLHLRARPELYHAIGRGALFISHPDGWRDVEMLERVIVFATGATKYPCFTLVPNKYIYANTVCVVASDSFSLFTCLSSDIHTGWAWERGSKMKQDLRYTHGDIFETFPLPDGILKGKYPTLEKIGKNFFEKRREYMISNNKGMTKFYNDLHNPKLTNNEIVFMRSMQTEINDLVLEAYGFKDINPDYGFHEVAYLPAGKNVRFTVSEETRENLLFKLGMLNKERHHEEEEKNKKLPYLNRSNKRLLDLGIDDLFNDDETDAESIRAGEKE
jgi:hypothetical protein